MHPPSPCPLGQAAVKAERAEVLKQERARRFAAGDLPIEELKYQELQEQCKLRGVPSKAYSGLKKPELLVLLQATMGEAAGQPASTAPPTPRAPPPPAAPAAAVPAARPAAPPPRLPPATAPKVKVAAATTLRGSTTPATEMPAGKRSRAEEDETPKAGASAPPPKQPKQPKLQPKQPTPAAGQPGLMAFFQRV